MTDETRRIVREALEAAGDMLGHLNRLILSSGQGCPRCAMHAFDDERGGVEYRHHESCDIPTTVAQCVTAHAALKPEPPACSACGDAGGECTESRDPCKKCGRSYGEEEPAEERVND
ncbi:MAG: hypothetical protein V3S01_09565 [Dehalococcoidia bacterium]